MQVRAARRTKKGKLLKGSWSAKKTFKTKSAVLGSYKLSGTLEGDITYKLKKAEMRKRVALSGFALVIFFTATNNAKEDEHVSGPNLNAYQNGIKLGNAPYFVLGLDEDAAGAPMGMADIMPGCSIDGWCAFKLNDRKTPVLLRSIHRNSDRGEDVIDFERTIKLS